jgi:hypothetical protein
MKRTSIVKQLISLFCIITIPLWTLAEGKPVEHFAFNLGALSSMQSDSIPPSKNTAQTPDNKPLPDADIIKVVPKARRQRVPVAVKVKIKPVKVIKPKIIRPIIKVLH